MSGDPGAKSDQPSDGRSEIDDLLEDLVYRHERSSGDETTGDGQPDPDVALPSAWVLSNSERPVGPPSTRRDAGGSQRRLAVLVIGSIMAAVVVVVVAGGLLSSGSEASLEGAPVGSSNPVDGSSGNVGPTETVDSGGGQNDSTAFDVPSPLSETSPEPDSQLRLGVVVPGRASDRAFSQSMVDGVARLVGDGSAGEMAVSEQASGSRARDEIRRLADEGNDLVIAHSSAFEPAVFEIAPSFPDVTFAVAGATDPAPFDNVYTYTVAAGEGGYVLGALGALLSPGNVIGVVGPIEVGRSKEYVDGFHQGAHDERADVSVRIAYTGSFSDAAAFASATERHLDEGADVITGHGHELDAAIEVAAERGAMWLGSQSDQTPVAPDSVVASQVYHWEVVIGPIVADIETDDINGRHLVANLANGGIVIDYNERRLPPAAVLERIDELTNEISTGSLRPQDGRQSG